MSDFPGENFLSDKGILSMYPSDKGHVLSPFGIILSTKSSISPCEPLSGINQMPVRG